MSGHQDSLGALNQQSDAGQKLKILYDHLHARYSFIARVAVALHDPGTDLLKTYAAAGSGHRDLLHYQVPLAEVRSLADLSAERSTRVIQDIEAAFNQAHPTRHTKALLESGFRGSYTQPLIYEGHFLGFVFFNASQPNAFADSVLTELEMVGHMIALIVASERSNVTTLVAAVRSAIQLTHSRDPETGFHLERMARYSRLIARKLAEDYGLTDEYVEHIYLFAPLHDLGKIKVPDRILLKPGRLDAGEKSEMQKHPEYGRELIDVLIENHGLSGVSMIGLLRNIALYHHEQIDGGGYPHGLRGDAIPLESRIVTVADVFDALTSRRPYKDAWPLEKALEELRVHAGSKWDADCVEALASCRDEILAIQRRFRENEYG